MTVDVFYVLITNAIHVLSVALQHALLVSDAIGACYCTAMKVGNLRT